MQRTAIRQIFQRRYLLWILTLAVILILSWTCYYYKFRVLRLLPADPRSISSNPRTDTQLVLQRIEVQTMEDNWEDEFYYVVHGSKPNGVQFYKRFPPHPLIWEVYPGPFEAWSTFWNEPITRPTTMTIEIWDQDVGVLDPDDLLGSLTIEVSVQRPGPGNHFNRLKYRVVETRNCRLLTSPPLPNTFPNFRTFGHATKGQYDVYIDGIPPCNICPSDRTDALAEYSLFP